MLMLMFHLLSWVESSWVIFIPPSLFIVFLLFVVSHLHISLPPLPPSSKFFHQQKERIQTLFERPERDHWMAHSDDSCSSSLRAGSNGTMNKRRLSSIIFNSVVFFFQIMPFKHGWLEKKGKQRWFIIRGGVLWWFAKETVCLSLKFRYFFFLNFVFNFQLEIVSRCRDGEERQGLPRLDFCHHITGIYNSINSSSLLPSPHIFAGRIQQTLPCGLGSWPSNLRNLVPFAGSDRRMDRSVAEGFRCSDGEARAFHCWTLARAPLWFFCF